MLNEQKSVNFGQNNGTENMQKIIFAFFLGICAPGLWAQDRLQPARSVFNDDSYYLDYAKILNKTFQPEEKELYKYLFRYLVLPSFSEEYFLGLTCTDGLYCLVYKNPEESVWNTFLEAERLRADMDSVLVNVQEIHRKISPESAELVRRLFEKAVLNARFPKPFPEKKIRINGKIEIERKVTIHLDGTNYYFAANIDTDYKTATIWSPDDGSKTDELVSILEAIIDSVRTKNGTAAFDRGMERRIKKLTSKL